MNFFFIGIFLSSIMYGAFSNDSDDRVVQRKPQKQCTIEDKERLLKKYFGQGYRFLQEGKVDQYWQRVSQDMQLSLYSFEEGLAALKDKMLFSWNDRWCRMQWVKNVRQDLIEPLHLLCAGDKPLTCESYFAGEAVQKGVGARLLKSYQQLREYSILSAVATYVSLGSQLLTSDSRLSDRVSQVSLDPKQCQGMSLSSPQKKFLDNHQPFFSSKRTFIDFCQFYSVGNLPKVTLHNCVELQKVNIRDYLYNLYSVEYNSCGIIGHSLLRPRAQVLMPERLAALQSKMCLHGMPYLEKGVEQFVSHGLWLPGSVCIFGKDLLCNRSLMHFAALWKKLYPHEPYVFAYILEIMRYQMKEAHQNPLEMLKIMVTFASALHSPFCPNIVVDNVQELLQSLQSGKGHILEEVCKDIMGARGQQQTCTYANHWYQKYFIGGLNAIIRKYGGPAIDSFNNHLFAMEYNMGHRQANLWTVLDVIMESGKEGDDNELKSMLLSIYYLSQNGSDKFADQWVKDIRYFLDQNPLEFVRYRLWDEPLPLVQWNETCKVLTVCLPKRRCMIPKVLEMQGLQSCHPILAGVRLVDLHYFINHLLARMV